MFGLRAYPTPIVKPLWPFMISGVFVIWGVSKLQSAALQNPEFAKDPRNPYAASAAKAEAHH
ncbi:ATPase, F0 complex, subunit J [Papiliotrema laurentii]|uniref:ATPase, F0 complex, subunit J n=1 Tax=Papiliotrema laurentii TaxID=5418 RepID=A0AAD9LAA3_PAPLA|nr:ATPase, F0 complex, subunit J [Papiliotrema laurentii]